MSTRICQITDQPRLCRRNHGFSLNLMSGQRIPAKREFGQLGAQLPPFGCNKLSPARSVSLKPSAKSPFKFDSLRVS
jgi:hypothetical protein